MDVLVTYDIGDTDSREGAKRLRRLATVLAQYGVRVQFSVFECRLSPERFARLTDEVREVIDTERDSVIFYRFQGGFDDARQCFGRRKGHQAGQPWIL